MNNLDEVAPEDEARAYRNKSYPRRMLVITAGSIMHMLIAVALFLGVYAVNGKQVESGRIGIGSVEAGYPAAQAGVRAGDIVLSIDGKPVGQLKDIKVAGQYSAITGYGLQIGRNTATPVSHSYSPPFAFTGKIEKVTIDMIPPKKAMIGHSKDRALNWD
jgi:membrane-associated protease RseP (regulator of RpoE activity)